MLRAHFLRVSLLALLWAAGPDSLWAARTARSLILGEGPITAFPTKDDAPLSLALPVGTRESRSLTIANLGSIPITVSLSVVPGSSSGFLRTYCEPSKIYLAEFGVSEFTELDPFTGKTTVLATGLTGPNGLAMDPAGDSLYLTQTNAAKLSFRQQASGLILPVTTSPLPISLAGGLALSPADARAYVTGSGSIKQIDLGTGLVSDVQSSISGTAGACSRFRAVPPLRHGAQAILSGESLFGRPQNIIHGPPVHGAATASWNRAVPGFQNPLPGGKPWIAGFRSPHFDAPRPGPGDSRDCGGRLERERKHRVPYAGRQSERRSALDGRPPEWRVPPDGHRVAHPSRACPGRPFGRLPGNVPASGNVLGDDSSIQDVCHRRHLRLPRSSGRRPWRHHSNRIGRSGDSSSRRPGGHDGSRRSRSCRKAVVPELSSNLSRFEHQPSFVDSQQRHDAASPAGCHSVRRFQPGRDDSSRGSPAGRRADHPAPLLAYRRRSPPG